MQVAKRNGVEIFTPRNFEDLYELTYILSKVTKSVIVDCEFVRVLPSHFISVAITKKDFIILVNVSYASKKIIFTIGAENVVCIMDEIISAMKHIEGKV
jgi:hypothetical protein